MSQRRKTDQNTATDAAKVLSSVFDVVFLIGDDGGLILYNDESAVFDKTVSVKDFALKKMRIKSKR